MTNEMIVFWAEQELAEEGVIGYTGRTFEVTDDAGKTVVMKETEPIHTYNTWKRLGYQVRRGEKCIKKLKIWKHAAHVDEETGEVDNERMFMKVAYFFSLGQVERMEATA